MLVDSDLLGTLLSMPGGVNRLTLRRIAMSRSR
jgi:hypothetical protein